MIDDILTTILKNNGYSLSVLIAIISSTSSTLAKINLRRKYHAVTEVFQIISLFRTGRSHLPSYQMSIGYFCFKNTLHRLLFDVLKAQKCFLGPFSNNIVVLVLVSYIYIYIYIEVY